MEDIDPPRQPPGAAEHILRALEVFDLHWDGDLIFQSRRLEAYQSALETLSANGQVFRCVCSRRDIAQTNAARGRAGSRVYPGTCRNPAPSRRGSKVLRMRTGRERLGIEDRLQGTFSQVLEEEVGDFVLRRRDVAARVVGIVVPCR